MIKSTGATNHAERKHLTERSLCSSKTEEVYRREKRHFCNTNTESAEQYPEKPKKMSEAMAKKLENDLYSKI